LVLLLEELGVTFEYLPGNKHKNNSADTLSHLDIESLKIQEEGEILILLSGSENNSISYIEFPIRADLIFK
jgi:ABC-type Fe2+-enterobactin transport system substrate-binding protein